MSQINSSPTFIVGDIVDWCGMRGVVTSTNYSDITRTFATPIRVEWDEKILGVDYFLADGRWIAEQKPTLVLISRPAQTEPVTLYKYLYKYHTDTIYETAWTRHCFEHYETYELKTCTAQLLATDEREVEMAQPEVSNE